MSANETLPSVLQEQFEQAIRDVIAGISHSDLEVIREIPDPNSDDELEVPDVPELRTISVSSYENERILSVTLHFAPAPDGDMPVTADEITYDADGNLVFESEQDPPYLSELGGAYAELSDVLIELLKRYGDAPGENPEQVFADEQADFLCTLDAEGGSSFSTFIEYPDYVETVYTEGHADVARRLGLPF